MLLEEAELSTLLELVRRGDEQAARLMVQSYEPYVRRVVRSRLGRRLRRHFDSMDFVQSVWVDFLAGLRDGRIGFHEPAQLARFLARAALGKVANRYHRHVRGGKYGLTREEELGASDRHSSKLLTSSEPSPSQCAAASERLERLMRGRPRLHRRVLLLRAQGFTYAEIAAKTNLHERTARRIVREVEKSLDQIDVG